MIWNRSFKVTLALLLGAAALGVVVGALLVLEGIV